MFIFTQICLANYFHNYRNAYIANTGDHNHNIIVSLSYFLSPVPLSWFDLVCLRVPLVWEGAKGLCHAPGVGEIFSKCGCMWGQSGMSAVRSKKSPSYEEYGWCFGPKNE